MHEGCIFCKRKSSLVMPHAPWSMVHGPWPRPRWGRPAAAMWQKGRTLKSILYATGWRATSPHMAAMSPDLAMSPNLAMSLGGRATWTQHSCDIAVPSRGRLLGFPATSPRHGNPSAHGQPFPKPRDVPRLPSPGPANASRTRLTSPSPPATATGSLDRQARRTQATDPAPRMSHRHCAHPPRQPHLPSKCSPA